MSFVYNPSNYSSGSGVSLAYLQSSYPTTATVNSELATKADASAVLPQSVAANAIGCLGIGSGAIGGGTTQTGNYNVAVGENALQDVTTGDSNTAVGFQALQQGTGGFSNVAVGTGAGLNCNSANNVLLGQGAGYNMTTNGNNVMVGATAEYDGSDNVCVGFDTGGAGSGSNSIFIGSGAKPGNSTDSNTLVIGKGATGAGPNTTVIGTGYVAGVSGQTQLLAYDTTTGEVGYQAIPTFVLPSNIPQVVAQTTWATLPANSTAYTTILSFVPSNYPDHSHYMVCVNGTNSTGNSFGTAGIVSCYQWDHLGNNFESGEVQIPLTWTPNASGTWTGGVFTGVAYIGDVNTSVYTGSATFTVQFTNTDQFDIAYVSATIILLPS